MLQRAAALELSCEQDAEAAAKVAVERATAARAEGRRSAALQIQRCERGRRGRQHATARRQRLAQDCAAEAERRALGVELRVLEASQLEEMREMKQLRNVRRTLRPTEPIWLP